MEHLDILLQFCERALPELLVIQQSLSSGAVSADAMLQHKCHLALRLALCQAPSSSCSHWWYEYQMKVTRAALMK